jgi:single-strand DNA-binding protein|uniref:Single-stranded DNA-binding protein n=1 Tax=candidate division WOR-3 bacterium TaxID=2052148 RepID=A0A7V3V0E3_UNCW3
MNDQKPNKSNSFRTEGGTGQGLRLVYLNNVILMGRLVADPDIRYTPKGTPHCTFRIALNRRFKDQNTNDWREETYFFTISTWGPMADRLSDRLKKGSAVLIQGELRSRSWETQTGEKRNVVEIHARNIQLLDRALPSDTELTQPEPDLPPDEEPDIPKDQLDDIPF